VSMPAAASHYTVHTPITLFNRCVVKPVAAARDRGALEVAIAATSAADSARFQSAISSSTACMESVANCPRFPALPGRLPKPRGMASPWREREHMRAGLRATCGVTHLIQAVGDAQLLGGARHNNT
jgi:hypothetical protein